MGNPEKRVDSRNAAPERDFLVDDAHQVLDEISSELHGGKPLSEEMIREALGKTRLSGVEIVRKKTNTPGIEAYQGLIKTVQVSPQDEINFIWFERSENTWRCCYTVIPKTDRYAF